MQQFRVWLRRGPVGERVLGAVSLLLVVALIAWLAPSGGAKEATSVAAGEGGPSAALHGGTAVSPNGAAGGVAQAEAGGVSGSSGSSGGSGSARATGGAGAVGAASGATTAAGCASPRGAPSGVTATQLKLAITVLQIVGPAGNDVFHQPDPGEAEAGYGAVIDSINATGGIACRKIVPRYFRVNPGDQSDLQAKCLEIAEWGAFAVLDSGSYAYFPQKQCFAQHHIPFLSHYLMAKSESDAFYPYLFESALFDTLYRNTVFALRDRGFFSAANGFVKLALPYQSCYPDLVEKMLSWLTEAGVPRSKVVTYDFGCPAVQPSPSDQAQAVLKFKQNGATHLTYAQFVGGLAPFTTVARQQGFRPKYGIPDDGFIQLTYGTQQPDFENLDGAIAISPFRSGEERTPGVSPSPATARCNAILSAKGIRPAYQQPAGVGGVACSELWVFKAAVEHAPALAQDALASGLQAAKNVDVSYPDGPNDLSGLKNTVWMTSWRAEQFRHSCDCWQLLENDFHPSYR